MKPFAPIAATLTFLALMPHAANAHPGHDGHELTWDFSHAMAHPVATGVSLAVVIAAIWLARIAFSMRSGARDARRSD